MRHLFKMRPEGVFTFHGAMKWETDRSPIVSKMKPALWMDGLRVVGFILAAVIVGFLLAAVYVLGQERAPQIDFADKNTAVLNGIQRVTFPLACKTLMSIPRFTPPTSGWIVPDSEDTT